MIKLTIKELKAISHLIRERINEIKKVGGMVVDSALRGEEKRKKTKKELEYMRERNELIGEWLNGHKEYHFLLELQAKIDCYEIDINILRHYL